MKKKIKDYIRWCIEEWNEWAANSGYFVNYEEFVNHSITKTNYQYYVATIEISNKSNVEYSYKIPKSGL